MSETEPIIQVNQTNSPFIKEREKFSCCKFQCYFWHLALLFLISLSIGFLSGLVVRQIVGFNTDCYASLGWYAYDMKGHVCCIPSTTIDPYGITSSKAQGNYYIFNPEEACVPVCDSSSESSSSPNCYSVDLTKRT